MDLYKNKKCFICEKDIVKEGESFPSSPPIKLSNDELIHAECYDKVSVEGNKELKEKIAKKVIGDLMKKLKN